MKKNTRAFIWVVLGFVLGLAGRAAFGQGPLIGIDPAWSVREMCEIVLAQTVEPTVMPPTATATSAPVTLTATSTSLPPTSTPIPTATNTPQPAHNSHGITRIGIEDWGTAADELGAGIVEYLVRSGTPDQVVANTADAQALGMQVLLHLYDSGQNTNHPWYLVNGEWQITSWGISMLVAVDGNPGVWGVYTLHEPWSSSTYDCDADCQRDLYTFLRQYTNLPLYSDISTLHMAEDAGEVLSDGMCDLCGIFPSRWPDIETTMNRLLADYDTQQRLMPNSKIVVGLNTYDLGDRYVMPTASQLQTVRDWICIHGLDYLYYPWTHGGYERELKDVPDLWPVIAQGCGEDPPEPTATVTVEPTVTVQPTFTPTNTPTNEPTATNTPAPSPTATSTPTHEPTTTSTPTPVSSGAIVIGHTADVESLSQAQLDTARLAITYFTRKSIGGNILDGLRDLAAQNPARYSISIVTGSGTNAGVNEYQVGSNGSPLTKIDGFAGTVRNRHEIAFMKLCTGDVDCVNGDRPTDEVWTAYRDMMVQAQGDHSDTVLVWWTWPIIASNHSRAHCNIDLEWFNDQVRAHVAQNGGALFDLADIESHEPDGTPVFTSQGYEAAWPSYTSDGAHLNEAGRQRVAGALWVLLAQVAEMATSVAGQ